MVRGGIMGGKVAVFDFGSVKYRNKTEMGIQTLHTYICYHYYWCILRPFVFWVGRMFAFFSTSGGFTTSFGALIALFSVMSCFGWFRSRWGLKGPTSLNTSLLSVICFSLLFFCCSVLERLG